jgi:hypothetical protein
MKKIYYFLIMPALLYLVSCGTTKQVTALKPLPDYSSTEVVYEKQLSFINMPVEVAVKDLQAQTNKYLSGLIYEDKSFDGDNLMMTVFKQNNIIVSEKEGKIIMDLPLKITGKVKYGFESFGINLSDVKDFYLNGTVRLSSVVGLKDWKITTLTTIQNITWKETPSVMVAGKSVPITYLINPAISIFKPTLSKLVDDAIKESLDIKPYVLDALQAFSQPVKVNEEYESWFLMQPIEVYTSKATVANQKITANLGLKAYLETSVGRKPEYTFNRASVLLKAVDNMPNEFKANVAAFATYKYASDVVSKNFAGEKFESGKRSVTVNKVDLWGKDGKMIVALNLSGSVNGDFYLTGFPAYDAVKKEIYLNQVDFVLDSKSKLIKIGDWLAHGLILKKMSDACRFSIADQLAAGEKTMVNYLNNYEPIKGVKVNGTLKGITPNKVVLTPNAIVAMVVASGNVAITIDGLE